MPPYTPNLEPNILIYTEIRISRHLSTVDTFSHTFPELAKTVSIDELYTERPSLLVRTQFYCDWNNERTTVI